MQIGPTKFNDNAPVAVHNGVVSQPRGERSSSPIVADVSDPSSPAHPTENTYPMPLELRLAAYNSHDYDRRAALLLDRAAYLFGCNP